VVGRILVPASLALIQRPSCGVVLSEVGPDAACGVGALRWALEGL